MSDFFRPEVLRSRQRASFGSARRLRPLSMTVVTTVFSAIALCLAGWLWTGVYTRTARLDGVVVGSRNGAWHAELFATAANRAALREEQSVRLRYVVALNGPDGAAAPSRGFIVSIASAPLRAAELGGLPAPIAARAAAEPLYKVTARIERPPESSTAGEAVIADVAVEQRRLIEWMFPLRSRDTAAG